jgi:peptide/nickel transport system ATP-binding protein
VSTLLDVRDLRVRFDTPSGPVSAVDGVSFQLRGGEILAIVGESGSGKSVTAMTLIGLTRGLRARIEGTALLEGRRELIGAPESALRRVRGARIAMVFQDPMSSLNPVHRVGDQIAEQIVAHTLKGTGEPGVSRARARARAVELMERVRIPAAAARSRSYPHELSGGMRQRVMIAMALSLGPRVLLADEPTTALDVTIQAQIIAQLKALRDESGMGIVLITHDFAVVADIADRIAVMSAGRIVEQGTARQILHEPAHDCTRALLGALEPPRATRATRIQGEILLDVRDLHVRFPGAHGVLGGPRGVIGGGREMLGGPPDVASGRTSTGRHHAVAALDGLSLTLRAGETLGVVGESGCGKTTLIRSIARLEQPSAGTIVFAGTDIARARRRALGPLREGMGMVFQDPRASLNPRRRVGRTLARSLRARGSSRAQARVQAAALLERVGLSADHAERYPHELSGGERQRVAIARALAGEPRLLLLDEPVSSLDASLRRGVIELLAELQEQFGCAYILVSHDLAMVAGVADRVAVMHAGRIVEIADARELFERPTHPYTRELLAASPALP